jgi:hypothetical protein
VEGGLEQKEFAFSVAWSGLYASRIAFYYSAVLSGFDLLVPCNKKKTAFAATSQ